MAQDYILVIGGKPQGPYNIEQLKAFGIKPGDFVKTSSMDDYKEAHEIAELRQLFHFKAPPVIPQYFGSFDQRLLASFIDWLIISGLFIIPAVIAVLLISNRLITMAISIGLVILIPLAKIIYHIVMESGDKQATYGKQILKIKVCNMEGGPINVSTATGRNLCKLFCVLTLFTGYLFSFFNRRQQCLHDMMAGTLVIKDRLI